MTRSVEILVEASKRDMVVLSVVYKLCRDDEPRAPKDVAAWFKDCSHQRATAHMYKLVGLDAARWDNSGGPPTCRPTEAGIAAMRHYFRDWRDHYSEDDDARVAA